ncbi:unnamed protein product [Cylindrotheca closterium]|uniref:ubiquitinyl hydrolase 1 n=1 Tax=Cylindrotheca closterium TaxID=2856 RepID=A0AAD2CFS5_9STRA|nr:unnamed protein product [Cylindrotheca closterium]
MRDPKIARFILEQELPPDSPTPTPKDQTSDPKQTKPKGSNLEGIKVLDQVRQLNLEACRDPHLEEYLPHLLNTQLCRTVDDRWIIANPVHSLHLASQVDESQQQQPHQQQQQQHSWKQNPVLFGDEEQRTIVLKSKGIAETWSPLDGNSAAIEEDRIVEPASAPPRFSDMTAPVGSMMTPFSPDGTISMQPMAARSAMPGIPSGVISMYVDTNQEVAQKPHMTPQQTVSSSAANSMRNASSPAAAQAMKSGSTANQINPKPLGGKNLSAIKNATSTSNDSAPSSSISPAPATQTSANPLNRRADIPWQETQKSGTQASVSAPRPSAIPVPKNTPSTEKVASANGKDNVAIGTQSVRQGKGGKGLLFAKHGSSSRAPVASSVTPQQTVKPKPDDQKPVESVQSNTATPFHVTSSSSLGTAQAQGMPSVNGQTTENASAKKAMDKSNPLQKPPSIMPTSISSAPQVRAAALQAHGLTDERFHQFRVAENAIEMVRQSIPTYGRTTITNKKKSESAKKKRKKDHESYRSAPVAGWAAPSPKVLNTRQESEWNEVRRRAPETVERWLENFRISRESYWSERRIKNPASQRGMGKRNNGSFYLPTQELCSAAGDDDQSGNSSKRKRSRALIGDELMTCLECGAIHPSPSSIAPSSKEGMLEHMLMSGHKFAVTRGKRAQVFSFGGGDFVYHAVFDQEKFRIDTMKQLPNLSWKEHKVQRSFDPFQFISTKDYGIVWRGPVATYPSLVPKEHVHATELIHRRKSLFEGRLREKWLLTKPNAMSFTASQHLLDETHRYKIDAPVGMYNLGNTCYMTVILQCLVHCDPLQQYFLRDSAHHYKASKVYRETSAEEGAQVGTTPSTENSSPKEKKESQLCLAYEMDRLFLSYYGSAMGYDVLAVIEESSHNLSCNVSEADEAYVATEITEVDKGEPLIPSSLLATIWKSEHLKHLAGYKQHDAHEFLNSFLEQMSKNIKQHRDRVVESINTARDDNCVEKILEKELDVVTRLFQGQLRSVLLCEECGTKRVQAEPFLNISLTLSEEVEGLERDSSSGGDGAKLSVQTCLDHYVRPERLADPVECPDCAKRTSTKTQHTFSKLPKILCLHLKRFDAARNKKIEEAVSFPARGLNMGPMLSHWSEVSSVLSAKNENGTKAEPRILYDLFGTANHLGNMQSGHYVSNVKVKDQWFHCNDQHVSRAGDGNGEEAVLNSEGAYILFYVRR